MKKTLLLSYYAFTIMILGISCTQSPINTTTTTTPIFTSTPNSTPVPSLTPTATFIPITPVFSGTEVPNSEVIISAENADRLTLLARWGNGNAYDAQYTPDGKYLVTVHSTGIYFYNTQDYSLVKHI